MGTTANQYTHEFKGDDQASCMSYRHWLIGMAMQGLLASGEFTLDIPGTAIEFADAVLAKLEGKP